MIRLFFVRCEVTESGAYLRYVSIYATSKVQKESIRTIFLKCVFEDLLILREWRSLPIPLGETIFTYTPTYLDGHC